jgi:hypothetical protein
VLADESVHLLTVATNTKERMMSTWLNVALVGIKFGFCVFLFAEALAASHPVAALLTGSLSLVTPAWTIASRVLLE